MLTNLAFISIEKEELEVNVSIVSMFAIPFVLNCYFKIAFIALLNAVAYHLDDILLQ